MTEQTSYHRHNDAIHILVKDGDKIIDHSCIANINQSKRHNRAKWSEYADFIVLACNSHKDLLAACKNAIKQMEDSPVQAQGDWAQGLFCGLEDRDITDRYAACRYGYDEALDKVQEWIIDEIEAAIEKAEP